MESHITGIGIEISVSVTEIAKSERLDRRTHVLQKCSIQTKIIIKGMKRKQLHYLNASVVHPWFCSKTRHAVNFPLSPRSLIKPSFKSFSTSVVVKDCLWRCQCERAGDRPFIGRINTGRWQDTKVSWWPVTSLPTAPCPSAISSHRSAVRRWANRVPCFVPLLTSC